MPRECYEFVDSRLRRSPPDRASAVPYGQAGENALRFPHLAHRSAAAHKLHSTPQQDSMNLISGNGETSSRLPAFSLLLPGSCPNNRNRRIPHRREEPASYPADRDRQKTRPLAEPAPFVRFGLQSGHAHLWSRIRRQFLTLIDARFSSRLSRSNRGRVIG